MRALKTTPSVVGMISATFRHQVLKCLILIDTFFWTGCSTFTYFSNNYLDVASSTIIYIVDSKTKFVTSSYDNATQRRCFYNAWLEWKSASLVFKHLSISGSFLKAVLSNTASHWICYCQSLNLAHLDF